MEKKRVSFTVTGAFVTKTAREWFWEEGKPWEKVEEFLLACMCGTDKSREELVALARDVVLGRAKFIGDTADGSYAMVTDDGEYAIKAAGKLLKRLKDEKEERRDLEIRLENLVDRIADEDCEWLLEERKPPEADMSPLLSSFLEQRKIENEHEDNYGWLEPNGEFHPVEFAEHQGGPGSTSGKSGQTWKRSSGTGGKAYRSTAPGTSLSARDGCFFTTPGWAWPSLPRRKA